MIPLNSMTKRLRSFFTTDATCLPADKPKRRVLPRILSTQEAEQVFQVSIAQLPAEEQQKQIQKRQWYKRLAQRQGIAEVEQQMDLYYATGDQDHRL